jgi:hypothetical protein
MVAIQDAKLHAIPHAKNIAKVDVRATVKEDVLEHANLDVLEVVRVDALVTAKERVGGGCTLIPG